MICETCKGEGEKSSVTCHGAVTTCMGYYPYWDEDGVYHNHDPNSTRSIYKCSRGHEFSKTQLNRCPAKRCGWGSS